MAAAAWWLAFYLAPFGLLAAMPGWRSRAVALLLMIGLVSWFLAWLRGVETLAFGAWATALLAAIAGICAGLVAWLAEKILRGRAPERSRRPIAIGIGALAGIAAVPILMPALAALFATW